MIGKNEIQSTLQDWLRNPSWKEYYDEAPSDRCREFIALEFYYSDTEDEKAAQEMDRIEAELNVEDLQHLAKYAGNNPRKAALLRRIETLQKKSQGGTRNAE